MVSAHSASSANTEVIRYTFHDPVFNGKNNSKERVIHLLSEVGLTVCHRLCDITVTIGVAQTFCASRGRLATSLSKMEQGPITDAEKSQEVISVTQFLHSGHTYVSFVSNNQHIEKSPAPVPGVKCPNCNSSTFYRYGRTGRGKQRCLCLVCGRQYSLNQNGAEVKSRPACPNCGAVMYLYKRESKVLRFRCSRYPECSTYSKITVGGFEG